MLRLAWLALTLALATPACGPTVDLTKGVEILDVATGWWDAGIVNGQNKLVPSVSFKLKNVSDQSLGTLQINALFHRVSEDNEWGSGFKTIAGSSGLAAGATSEPQTIVAQLGYTGAEPRQQMLQNPQFVDAKVQLFAKYSSTQWIRIGEYPVVRRLIAP